MYSVEWSHAAIRSAWRQPSGCRRGVEKCFERRAALWHPSKPNEVSALPTALKMPCWSTRYQRWRLHGAANRDPARALLCSRRSITWFYWCRVCRLHLKVVRFIAGNVESSHITSRCARVLVFLISQICCLIGNGIQMAMHSHLCTVYLTAFCIWCFSVACAVSLLYNLLGFFTIKSYEKWKIIYFF